MILRGAVFDLDGTLLDSMGVWSRMGSSFLKKLGYEPKEGIDDFFTSFSIEEAALYYIEEYHVPYSKEELVKGIDEVAERYYREVLTAKKGVGSFLEELEKRGVLMCVASATDTGPVEAALSRCGIRGFFKGVVTCATVGKSKKDPLIYREALKLLGTDKKETVVFEDAAFAVKTAKKDGFTVAAVYDGYERDKAAVKAFSDILIEDFSKPCEILKQIEKI